VRIIVDCVDGDGLPIDISEVQSIRWAAARSVNDAPVLSKSLGSGISINTPTSFLFDISNTESEPLHGTYYHEAEIINDSGLVYTVLSGKMYLPKTLIKPV